MKKILILLCLIAVLSAVFVGCSDMITGLTATDNTPAGADAAALSTDDITFASGDTVDAVTGNFTLPINGEANGSTISWESSDTDVIAIDNETGIATVTRPSDEDADVTLTATFTDDDGNTFTKTISVTVAAQEATAIPPTAVTFESAVQTGGSSDVADSTGLTLTFDIDPTTLAASDITVTGATKGALSGSGTTRSLALSDITVGDGETVSVTIANPSGFTISGSPQTAVVYRAPTIVTISAIPGVTAPVLGNIPVTTITETDQYTGTVSWDGGWAWSNRFGGQKAYTVTITLTAKAGYTLTGVTADFFTVAGTTSDTNPADSGVVTAVFPATASVAIGNGVLGGKVAYILQSGDPGYVAGEQRGLIAATEDQSTGIVWISGGATQNTSVPDGTGTALGTGSANTDNIIAQAVDAGNNTPESYAAGLARAHNGGGYTDWYLPSKDELDKLHANKVAIGNFDTAFDGQSEYLSSSEYNAEHVWGQGFFAGVQFDSAVKGGHRPVRAVRAF